jgi:hypothetical protein
LDILDHVLDLEAVQRHLALSQGVEHERIVEIWGMPNVNRSHHRWIAECGLRNVDLEK